MFEEQINMMAVERIVNMIIIKLSTPCQQSLSFGCSILAGKTLNKSSKIFVEHARHVARIWFPTQT